jgi:TPP-dependent pyruvate/acetoin dehydrogenase alpha subunit
MSAAPGLREKRAPAAERAARPGAHDALALLRRMMLIRAFEERVRSLFAGGLIPGLVHLCSGQEAVAVGVCSVLRPSDFIASNHRGHGHCIAKGARLDRLMAELMGRRDGYGRGRGGSLHVFDPANGNLGTNGIVGGGIPLAAGAALSAKRLGRDDVAVCFFGDGALNQGLFFEVMNMAAIWRLPVLFVCENNGYGEFTASEDVTAGRVLERGRVFGIPSEAVDGMDVLAVQAAAARAVTSARDGAGPAFLVCTTYRYSGHHAGDRQDYKSDAETREWQQKDPIVRLGRRLKEEGLASSDRIAGLEAEVEAEVRAAVDFARSSLLPDAGDLPMHLHA